VGRHGCDGGAAGVVVVVGDGGGVVVNVWGMGVGEVEVWDVHGWFGWAAGVVDLTANRVGGAGLRAGLGRLG